MSNAFGSLDQAAAEHRFSAQMLVLLLIVALVKLSLVALFGPTDFPDTGAYRYLSQEILSDPTWWRDGGWGPGYALPRLVRPYGYPLLMAAARLAAGSGDRLLLVLAQTLASLAVLWLFAGAALRLTGRNGLALLLVVLCAGSGFLLFDLAILTDSFYASLFVAVFLLIGAAMTGEIALDMPLCLGLGVAWALSITLRDVGLLHSALPLAGILAGARLNKLGGSRTIGLMLAFLVPVLLLWGGVLAWNQARTGHAFFSITGGVNWLWPSINLADRGLADPFACADAVCRAAQAHRPGPGMAGVLDLANALTAAGDVDPQAFGRITFSHFKGLLTAHPGALILAWCGNLQLAHLADLIFNPLANLNEFAQLHAAVGERWFPGLKAAWQAVRGGRIGLAPLALVEAMFGLAALLGLLGVIAATPVLAVRALRKASREAAVALYFWAAAAAFIASYALVHMEMRHALPAVPLILLAAGWTAGAWPRRGGRKG